MKLLLTKRQKGANYERKACSFLAQRGFLLVAKNFHSRFGEIDLIMQKKDTLLFVEVRYRETDEFGLAQETITRHKQQRIQKTAAYFLQKHPLFQHYFCRFDIIAFNHDNIEWIQHAFI